MVALLPSELITPNSSKVKSLCLLIIFKLHICSPIFSVNSLVVVPNLIIIISGVNDVDIVLFQGFVKGEELSSNCDLISYSLA